MLRRKYNQHLFYMISLKYLSDKVVISYGDNYWLGGIYNSPQLFLTTSLTDDCMKSYEIF